LQKKEMLKTVTKANIGQHSKALENKDINEAYATRIKSIFSAIVEFVVIAREKISGKYAKALQIYSRAVRELALAVKAIKHLQKNLLVQVKSPNIEVKYLYNELRWLIINTVREIEAIRSKSQDGNVTNLYKVLQKTNQKRSSKIVKAIENNIRKQLISAQTSTSLITDTEYAMRACTNLIDAAKKLFVENKGIESKKIEETQDQNELSEILQDN